MNLVQIFKFTLIGRNSENKKKYNKVTGRIRPRPSAARAVAHAHGQFAAHGFAAAAHGFMAQATADHRAGVAACTVRVAHHRSGNGPTCKAA
jgi:hypothetical protein